MTTYTITGTAPALYVIQTIAHGHTTHQDIKHGPYKNDESAKRRIRDLKRKDVQEAANVASCTPATDFETGIKADGDIGTECITAQIASDLHAEISNDVAKLAMSSAYGKIVRQRGCYPAVSKHSYQR